jgi:hypothetical protein
VGTGGKAWADAVITITGTLDPITVEMSVTPTTLTFSLPTGVTEDTETVTVTNRAIVPVKVSVVSLDTPGAWYGLVAGGYAINAAGKMEHDVFGTVSLTEAQQKLILQLETQKTSPAWKNAPVFSWVRFEHNNTGDAQARYASPNPAESTSASWITNTQYSQNNTFLIGVLNEAPDNGEVSVILPVKMMSDVRRLQPREVNMTLTLRIEVSD